jgi:type II secretory pathway component PulK
MLPMMDDQLYGFFEPTLTAQRTPGININSLQEAGLRALVPNLTDDEVKDFFKYRDDPEQDNTFQSADDFYTYLKNSTAAYKNNDTAIGTLKSTLAKRNIQLIVEEKEFKITVVATVNQSVRKIEAWVTLMGKSGNSSSTSSSSSSTPQATPSPAPTAAGGNIDQQPVPDPGVRITFMRVS